MKRVAGVIAVVVLVVWAKVHFSSKPGDPSMEQMAEKFGRTARERLAHKNDPAPKGLQINETSTQAAPPTTSDAAPTSATSESSPEDAAKARVLAMLTAWKGDSKGVAVAIWAHNLQSPATYDFKAAAEAFDRFRQEKSLGDKIAAFEVTGTIRRVNGQDQYTAVDVTLDGVMYHMGVPDAANPIFWTF